MIIQTVFSAIFVAGVFSFFGFMVTAITSRSSYEDAVPAFLLVAGVVLLVVGGVGLLLVRMSA